jgi:putative phosphoesterase
LGVVSDTHGDLERTRAAAMMLEELAVDVVLHCGDIGSVEVVRLFEPWPTHYVLGNCDYDSDPLRHAIAAAGHTLHNRFGSLELAGLRIAFLHGDDSRRLHDTIVDGQWSLVCHGHTHVARQTWEGDTLVLNPGAIHRANPHSIAAVELPRRKVHIVSI